MPRHTSFLVLKKVWICSYAALMNNRLISTNLSVCYTDLKKNSLLSIDTGIRIDIFSFWSRLKLSHAPIAFPKEIEGHFHTFSPETQDWFTHSEIHLYQTPDHCLQVERRCVCVCIWITPAFDNGFHAFLPDLRQLGQLINVNVCIQYQQRKCPIFNCLLSNLTQLP